jgi:hypothetical protein
MTTLKQLSALTLTTLLLTSTTLAGDSVNFSIKQLAIDANEGCDIADFNNDGQLDIIAGRNWYAGPDFTSRPVRNINDWNGYVESNGDFAHDVDGDGWVDVIAVHFLSTEIKWYKNPGEEGLKRGHMWQENLLVEAGATKNECEMFHDLDGDGLPEFCVNSWDKNSPLLAWKLTTEERMVEEKRGNKTVKVKKTVPTMKKLTIGAEVNGHGLGFGDINGDGHEDAIFENGWYERPATGAFKKPWKLHKDWFAHASIPMYVRDLNHDGRNDIIMGMGHDYGLFWWEQKAPTAEGRTVWEKHLIDDSFSQPHTLHLADIDGDGAEDLITGKRVYAHNGRDPGGEEPPVLYYYTWNKKKLKFTRHTIDEGSAGTGLQIQTADLNGDGRLDIAVAGKSGTYVIINEGK